MTEFKECPTCAAKPGTPVLCDSCLHNRHVIGYLAMRPEEPEGQAAKALDGYLGDEGSVLWRIRMAVDAARGNQSIPDVRHQHLQQRYQAQRRQTKLYRKAMKQYMNHQRAEKFLALVEEIERLKRELAAIKAVGKEM